MEVDDFKCLSISSLKRKRVKKDPYSDLQEIFLSDEDVLILKKKEKQLKRKITMNRGKLSKTGVIEGKYSRDFNIVIIHEAIIVNFIMEIRNITNLIDKYNREIKKVKKLPFKVSEKTRVKNIAKIINNIKNNVTVDEYLEESKYYIDKYSLVKKTEKKIIFGFENEETTMEENEERLSLVDSYIDFSKKYIRLNITKTSKHIDKCEYCGEKYKPLPSCEEGLSNCSKCGVQRDVYVVSNTIKEISIKHVEGKDHLNIDNMIKVLKRFQGQQQTKPPKQLYVKMDEYFVSIGRPTGEEIKKLPLNEKGRRGDTDFKMLFEVLSKLGYNDYYEDAILIGHEYWGWLLPNISRFESKIIDFYTQLQRVFLNLEKDRTSNLGTQYTLYKLLQLVCGDKYPKDMFKISELLNSIEEHETLWEQMCKGCNNPEIYYIRTH